MKRLMFTGGLGVMALVLLAWSATSSAQGDKPAAKAPLGNQVKAIFTKHCHRCHGQNGAVEGSLENVLDFAALRKDFVKAKDPKGSYLFERMGIKKDMPPSKRVTERPTDDEIAVVKQWIEAGALDPEEKAAPRVFLSLEDELSAAQKYLRGVAGREDRKYIRFFTLRHLHNLPNDGPRAVLDADLGQYQAALAKLLNSLSWKKAIVVPAAVDKQRTLFAVDIRKLDWDRLDLWDKILAVYPYGLKHDSYPDKKTLNDLAEDVYTLAGTKLPIVRADWFIATASRPPLYHDLVQIPMNAGELEGRLKVNVTDNIKEKRAKRAGFNASGVSGSNRLVERHESEFGAYWKSYDFKSSTGFGNLFVFPLGPKFQEHPFDNDHAFKHDGGEIIFNLPNGLQAYMLVDGKDNRIDAGPIAVVNDSEKTSGTPEVINGLSCMNCHARGMRRFTDQVRGGHILAGKKKSFLEELYPSPVEMDKLVLEDEERFLTALDKACADFLKAGPVAKKTMREFDEPIAPIAKWYLVQEIDLLTAARELGLDKAEELSAIIKGNEELQKLGLFPLARGNKIKREVWESRAFLVSPYQVAAQKLKLGAPITK